MFLATLIILIIFFIIASAFFSGTETSFISVDKLLVERAANKNVAGAKYAKKLLDNQTRLLSTTLIGNNITLILATSLAALVFDQFICEEIDELATTIVMTPILLIFAEITPKSIARNKSFAYVLKSSHLLIYIERLFSPITYIVLFLTNFVLKIFGVNNLDNMLAVTREEVQMMADISVEDGLIGKKEHTMIKRVFDLNKTTLASVMKPLVELQCLYAKISVEQFLLDSQEHDSNFYPVFEDRPDNIVGIIYLNDVLKKIADCDDDLDQITIEKLVDHEVPFIPENRIAATLLNEFQAEQYPILFAIDEYGGVSGMITIVDFVEEITGELTSLDNKNKPHFIVHSAGIDCDGRAEVEQLSEALNISFDKDGYETIAGLILKLAGRVPAAAESFSYNGLTFTVLKANRKRIERVRITQDG